MFPNSYKENTRHEKEILELANNFHRQYKYFYPSRINPPLYLQNECKVNKITCTALCPLKIKMPIKMKEYNCCANFVSDYFDYELLPSPLASPQQLFSVESILKRRKGNSLDLSTVLCTFLLASDYDAYVVQGYARKNICEKRIMKEPKPPIRFDTNSEYHKRFFTESKPVSQDKHVVKNKYEVNFDLMKSFWLEGKSMFQPIKETEPESPPEEVKEKDIYLGKRIHFWVLIITYENGCLDGFFIEPTTGEKKFFDDPDYLGIEFVWNNENFWCNNQVIESSCKNLKFDLDDPALWEPFLPEFQINEEYDKPIRMPDSWVKDIEITEDDLHNRLPENGKFFHYKMATIAKYNPKTSIDGLIYHVTYYKTAEKKEKEEIHAFYLDRKDSLEYRKIDFRKKRITDIFALGRDDALKEHEYPLVGLLHFPQTLKFYSNLRKDKLITRNWTENETLDEFIDSPDRLIARKVVFFQEDKPNDHTQSYIRDSKSKDGSVTDDAEHVQLSDSITQNDMEELTEDGRSSKERIEKVDAALELKVEESTKVKQDKKAKKSTIVQNLLNEITKEVEEKSMGITPSSFDPDNLFFFEDIDFNTWGFESFLNSIDPSERYVTSESESEDEKYEYDGEGQRRVIREKHEKLKYKDDFGLQNLLLENQNIGKKQIPVEKTEDRFHERSGESEILPQVLETYLAKIPHQYKTEKEGETKLEIQTEEDERTKSDKKTRGSKINLLDDNNEGTLDRNLLHFNTEIEDDIQMKVDTHRQENKKDDNTLKSKNSESYSQDEKNLNIERIQHSTKEKEDDQAAIIDPVTLLSAEDKSNKDDAKNKKSNSDVRDSEKKEDNETKMKDCVKEKETGVNKRVLPKNKNDAGKSKTKERNNLQDNETDDEFKSEMPNDSIKEKVTEGGNKNKGTITNVEITSQKNKVEGKSSEVENDSHEDERIDNATDMLEHPGKEKYYETKEKVFAAKEELINTKTEPREPETKENVYEAKKGATDVKTKFKENKVESEISENDSRYHEKDDYVTKMLEHYDGENGSEIKRDIYEVESLLEQDKFRVEKTRIEKTRIENSYKNIDECKTKEKSNLNENMEEYYSSDGFKTKKMEGEFDKEIEIYDEINFDALSDEELETDYQLFLSELWKEYKFIKDKELFYMTKQLQKYKDLDNKDILKLKQKIIRKRRNNIRNMQRVKDGKPEVRVYKRKSASRSEREKNVYANDFMNLLNLKDTLKIQNATDIKEFYEIDELEKPYVDAINAEIIKKECVMLLDKSIKNNKNKNLTNIRYIKNTYRRDLSLPIEHDIENVCFDFEVDNYRLDFHYPPGKSSRKILIFSKPSIGNTDFHFSDNLCREILPSYQTKQTNRSQLYTYLVNLLREEPLVRKECERFQKEMKDLLKRRLEEDDFKTDAQKTNTKIPEKKKHKNQELKKKVNNKEKEI